MKRIAFLLLMLIFLYPDVAPAVSVIYLKSGGRLTTPAWSREGDTIVLQTAAGLMSIESREVLKIVSDDAGTLAVPAPAAPAAPERAGKDALQSPAAPANGSSPAVAPATLPPPVAEKVDLDVYKARKNELQEQLNAALARMREFARQQDESAKEQARREMREISARIYELTDEVKRVNNGVLPPGWWQ
jgi:hypothetical protein